MVLDLVRAHYEGSDEGFDKALEFLMDDESAKGNASVAVALQHARSGRWRAPIVRKDQGSPPFTISKPMDRCREVSLTEPVEKTVQKFVEQQKRRDELESHGIEPVGRLLLHGPPGCGKTMTAHLIAAELGLDVMTANFDTLVSSSLGGTASNIGRLFDLASSENALLFIDEFDAIARSRGGTNDVGEMNRVVVSLTQNMDRYPAGRPLVVATNMYDSIDRAVLRRFEMTVRMELPDESQRKRIISNLIQGHLGAVECRLTNLAKMTDSMSGSDISNLMTAVVRRAILDGCPDAIDSAYVLGTLSDGASVADGRDFYSALARFNRNGVSYAQMSRELKIPESTLKNRIKQWGSE